ncbi:MAG: response regulator, partial [Pseudomonadota bacterium]
MPAKILVVDDERDLQELVRRKFRREIRHGEFAFAFADNGHDALQLVQHDPEIDLVVTDLNMPGMDGLTLLEHLAEFEERLKTIVISAYGDMSNIRAAMNRGAFDFVTKPIDFPDLLMTMKKTLDQLDLFKEAIQQRAIAERQRGNLARYFPPRLVEDLAQRDEPFGAPRQQSLGLLFVDIRDFTSLSEAMAPADVMEMLRDFHALVEAAVFEHDGTLHAYVGDEVFATFGVPEPGPNDGTNTLACARALLKSIASWNLERQAAGASAIGIGVGVHHGSVVLGDVGTDRAMAFVAIGDAINVASRLQGLTRVLDTDLVLSQALIDQINR